MDPAASSSRTGARVLTDREAAGGRVKATVWSLAEIAEQLIRQRCDGQDHLV